MNVLAIDPGNEQSAIVAYDGKTVEPMGIMPNEDILIWMGAVRLTDVLAIEMIESFGMAVGKEVFETVFWTGRFCEAFPGRFERVYRKEVKLHLCQSLRAKDGNIRQALIDRFPATGGGKTPQIGTKSDPGPLYGMKSHMWSALAVAVTWWDTKRIT